MKVQVILFFSSFTVFLSPLFSQESESPTRYHLFKPAPKEQMREMHTDRPDVTETPFTVDAGHFQFEFDAVNVYRHPLKPKGDETDLLFLNGIAKAGITDFMDFEVLFSAAQWHFPNQRAQEKADLKSRRGFGDIGFRGKFNLLGNKHEKYGIAIMPSFLLPLNNKVSENLYIPGLTAIWAYIPNNKWEFGGQIDFYRMYDLDRSPLYNEIWVTGEVGYEITNKFDIFTEYVAILTENNNYLHTLNAGIILKISPNFNLDFAFNYGLNSKSPSSVFTGFSFRI